MKCSRWALAVLVVIGACRATTAVPPIEHVDQAIAPAPPPSSVDELRSPEGDLTVPLPEQWTILPLTTALQEGTIGVAIDPQRTMALVVQRVPLTDAIARALADHNVRALARACFDRRLQRTGNAIRLLGGFEVVAREQLRFGTYSFVEARADSVPPTRVATVASSRGAVYELALTPVVLTLDRSVTQQQLDSTFRRFLQWVQVQ